MNFKSPKSDSLTKSIASASYPFLFGVLLNETNPERAITQILERVFKEGKVSRRLTETTPGRTLGEFVSALSRNPNLRGFDSLAGRSILAGWLQSTIVEMGNTKKGGSGEMAIDYIKPLSAAAYRAGFPRQRQRHRGSDVFVYRSMLSYVSKRLKNPDENVAQALKAELIHGTSLGAGIDLRMKKPFQNPSYDGATELDVNVLLLLRMVESVEGLYEQPADVSETQPLEFPVEFAGEAIGKDFFDFASNFSERTTGELIEALVSLTAFRLYQLPIATALSVEGLLRPMSLDSKPRDFSGLEMFVDFTNGESSSSLNLARQCVKRDMGKLGQFFSDAMRLRSVEYAALQAGNDIYLELGALKGAARLNRLIELQEEPRVEMQLGALLHAIEQQCAEHDAEQLEAIQRTRSRHQTHLDIFTDLVMQDRGKQGIDGIRKWMYSTGGLTGTAESTYFASLAGTKKAPGTWRYKLSDTLLISMLDLCFLNEQGKLRNAPISMSELLDRLRTRFGILIDRPPLGQDDPDCAKAGADNFAAFVAKLKVMGYFRGLSDDFNAQFVQRPSLNGR